MKTVILCGGRGTRLGEHGANVPKALIEIGGRPVLWHLMKGYAHSGLNDFVLCLGYLGESIKRYFIEREWFDSDFTLAHGERHPHQQQIENWRITFADTGLNTNTGGRIHRIKHYLGDDETFCVTYGDGLADLNILELMAFHQSHGKLATLTAVHPQSTFGLLRLDENQAVTAFVEKPVMSEWINGGFFVFNRGIFDYLDDDCVLERAPFERLAQAGELIAYQHTGFWKCMDTYKDNLEFNQLWDADNAAWRVW